MLTNWVRLLRLVLSEKKGLVVILSILTVCIALFPFIQSGAEALFINELARGAAVKTFPPLLLYAMVAVIASLIIRPLTNTLNDYLTKLLWFYNDEKLTVALLKKRGELDVGTLEHPKYQDLLNKINEGGVWRVQNTTERLFIIFQQLIEFAVASVALFLAKWWLLPVVLASVVPELMTQLVYARQVWEISGDKAEVRRRYWELRSHFENKPALIEIKLFQSVSYLLQSIRSLFRDFHAAQLKLDVKQYRLQFITQTIANAALAAATVAFALDVVSGKTQIGTFTFLLAVTHRFRGSLSWLFRTIGHQYEDNLFVSDIFAFLDTPRALPRPERGYIVKATRVPEIVFDRVTFSYPDSSSPALSDFSLTIRPGEKLAVVGANGSGKTTFVKLLCRFYDPTSGNILVDGRRLPSVSLDSWYRVLGVLFQQYAHYHFTVKETIAMGRSDAPLDLA
ncbi:MAG: ABC transporter ATP-binding protein, partial [Candidatus Colwellbacteria bacterium]|nr:ABC transporter ATP-binding protein [Candidatus Colwellbacteria bacterium]